MYELIQNTFFRIPKKFLFQGYGTISRKSKDDGINPEKEKQTPGLFSALKDTISQKRPFILPDVESRKFKVMEKLFTQDEIHLN